MRKVEQHVSLRDRVSGLRGGSASSTSDGRGLGSQTLADVDGPAQASLLLEAVGNQCSQVRFGPWTLLLLAVSLGLFLRAGPREETSLHMEHCALSPGPRTTVGKQNADPCVKMIQNSRWQEQAVQAERGVPVIKQPPVSQEEAQRTTDIWGSSRVQEGRDAAGRSVAHPPCRG